VSRVAGRVDGYGGAYRHPVSEDAHHSPDSTGPPGAPRPTRVVSGDAPRTGRRRKRIGRKAWVAKLHGPICSPDLVVRGRYSYSPDSYLKEISRRTR